MKLVEESLWRLKIDGKPAINELAQLETALASAKKAQENLQRGTKEWTDAQKEIKAMEAEIKKVRETMGTAGMTVKQLEGYSRQLNKEIKDLTPGTEAYLKKTEELKDVNTRLANVRKDVKGVSDEVVKTKSSWDNLKEWVTGALAAFSIIEVIQAVVNFTKESLLMAASISDAFSDIQKATGMTKEEVEKLNGEIQKIDTRTAQESLLDIAKVGGAIGVANDELLGFVKSTDMAVVALGDEFSGGAEEVAQKMGTLSKLFKETKELDAGDAINKIGSAVNELGAAGTATGPVVAEFATRLGQMGELAPKISETLGLGAAFQELGLSAEIAAGGLSNILGGAAAATELFANHLGMTEQKFKDLINSNPNEVILKLAASFKGLPTDVVVKQMNDLGIKSQEAQKTMMLLATQTDDVRKKQELAAKAMAEGTSLTNEFNIKNTNAAATLEKAKKEVAAISLALGQALLPALVNITTGFISLLKIVGAAPAFIRENKEMFIALGAAILGMNGALISATASSIAHAAAEKARLVWSQSVAAAQVIQNIALEAMAAQNQKATTSSLLHAAAEKARALVIGTVTAAKSALVAITTAFTLENIKATASSVAHSAVEKTRAVVTGTVTAAKSTLVAITTALTLENIKATASSVAHSAVEKTRAIVTNTVAVAQGLLNAVMAANPIGLVITLIGGLIAGFMAWYDRSETLRAGMAGLWAAVKTVGSVIADVWGALTSLDFGKVTSILSDGAKQVAAAFSKGYQDQLKSEAPKTAAAHQAALDAKAAASKKGGKDAADAESQAKLDALKKGQEEQDALANAARATNLEETKKAAKKAAEEKIKAEKEARKIIEDAHIESIKNEEEREIAKLGLATAREQAKINESKVSQEIKATWERALVEKLERDVADVQKKYRDKRLEEERAVQKILEDTSIKMLKDEEQREYAKLGLSVSRELERIEQSKVSQETKAAWEKALYAQLEVDIAEVQKKYREKKQAEEREVRKLEDQQRSERVQREYETHKIILESQLANDKLSIDQRRKLKLELIDLEHQRELARIEDVAQKERDKAKETSDQLKKLAGDDADKKKQIDADYAATSKAIDDKLLTEKAAANVQHQNDKKEVERQSLEERRANHDSFFSAIRSLMNGDFTAFSDYLVKKLGNERAMNDERLQNWTNKTGEILNIVGQAIQTMSALNDKYLELQIARNNKERDDKILKLQQQYKKGLIDKDTYEKGINSINQQADAKEKELKLKAWKRDQAMQIAMAVINGAMAALKSLATMGWPLGLVGVAASAVMTGVNIALIKAQKPPTFAQGGMIKNAGVPEGPRHGSSYGKGGIGMYRRDTGEEVGEMEGGEPIMILSRNTYRNNRKVIDQLLHSSLHRNGAPIYAERGAVFGSDGGTYGDMLGRMYNEGGVYGQGDYSDSKHMNNGWGDNNSGSSQYDSPYETEPDYGDMGYTDWDGSYDDGSSGTGDAYATTQLTTAEIQKSQALMERIGKNTNDTANFTEKTMRAVLDLNSKMDQAIGVLNGINGAANRTADNAGNAANAGWAAAGASNRAADAIAMAAANDL